MENKNIQTYKDLDIWKRSLILVKNIYTLTSDLPGEEKFGLVSQMRRCAVSVPSNIAEGAGRGSQKDFAQFLRVSRGSLYELDTQLLITQDVYNKDTEELRKEINELIRMTTSLIKSLMKNS